MIMTHESNTPLSLVPNDRRSLGRLLNVLVGESEFS